MQLYIFYLFCLYTLFILHILLYQPILYFVTLNTFFILVSTITGYIPVSVFPSLLGIPIGMSSAIGLKICAIAAGIKKV